MAYYRKRPRTTRRSKKLTASKVYRQGKSASTQQRQIATLSRKVNKVARSQAQGRIYGQFCTNASLNIGSPYLIRAVQPGPGARIPVFDTSSDVGETDHFKFTKVNMDILIQPANEANVIDMTFFLVTLKPDTMKQTNVETSFMTTLESDVHFRSFSNSLTYVNTSIFKIHMCKRIQTFENYTDGTPETRGFHRIYKKMRVNMDIKSNGSNWTSVTDNEWPLDQRYYFLIFNNNSVADLQYPTISYNCLWSGYAS